MADQEEEKKAFQKNHSFVSFTDFHYINNSYIYSLRNKTEGTSNYESYLFIYYGNHD